MVRARNLASRQDNLITEFMSIAKQCGRNITVQPERYLTEVISDSRLFTSPQSEFHNLSIAKLQIQYRYNENTTHLY